MMLGIEREVVIFFYAVLTGSVVFCGYQILLLFRKLVKHRHVVEAIEDLLFWLAVSMYLFRQMYCPTYGSIRWFFVVGIVSGALAAGGIGRLLQRQVRNRKEKESRKSS